MLDRRVETDARSAGTQDHQEDRQIVIEPKRARAGRKGLPVLYVLLFSTALAIIALFAIWAVFYAHGPH